MAKSEDKKDGSPGQLDPMVSQFNIEVEATLDFINLVGLKKTAEFLVYQQRAIDGLRENNDIFWKAYRKKLNG